MSEPRIPELPLEWLLASQGLNWTQVEFKFTWGGEPVKSEELHEEDA